MDFDIKDIKLAKAGKLRIEWAAQQMTVLNLIRKRFGKTKPLRGIKIVKGRRSASVPLCL